MAALERHLGDARTLAQQLDGNELADNAQKRQDRFQEKFSQLQASLIAIKTLRRELASQSGTSQVTLAAGTAEERFQRLEAAVGALATGQKDLGARRAALAELRRTLAPAAGVRRNELASDQAPGWQMGRAAPQREKGRSSKVPAYLSQYDSDEWRRYFAQLRNTTAEARLVETVAPPPTPPEAASCGYVAADLADNLEAPASDPEILALAESLSYSPAKIYQWVSSNIEFEPYFGSLKGAKATLWSKSGGPTDQASLLIALLRASKVPARYVYGTIGFDSGDTRVLDWLGVKTGQGAQRVLALGKNPWVVPYGPTGGIQFDHVWVEACIPYSSYRGTRIDNSGNRWVPLDASFKLRTKTQDGIAITSQLDYSGAPGTYMATRSALLPQEVFARQVESEIRAANGNNTLQDVPYGLRTTQQEIDILPPTLPYVVMGFFNWDTTSSPEVSTVPDSHRYRLGIRVANGASPLMPDVYLQMPEVSLKRLTMYFEGANPADRTAITNWRNGGNPDASLPSASVIPRIASDGVVRSSASGLTPISFGTGGLGLTMVMLAPGDTQSASSIDCNPTVCEKISYTNIDAVNYHALQAYAFQGSDRLLRERSARLLSAVTANSGNANANPDEIEGEFLHIAGLKYMRYISDANKTTGRLYGETGDSGNHMGIVVAKSNVSYVFDLPFAVYRSGFLIDIAGGQSRSVDLSTGGSNWNAFLLGGYTISAYESYIWQEMSRLDAVSTVRGLQFARETGIPIIKFAPNANGANGETPIANYAAVMQMSGTYSMADQQTAITALVVQGKTVTVPRQKIQYGTWNGAVYISQLQGPTSFNSSFIITGGYNGGYTVCLLYTSDAADE